MRFHPEVEDATFFIFITFSSCFLLAGVSRFLQPCLHSKNGLFIPLKFQIKEKIFHFSCLK